MLRYKTDRGLSTVFWLVVAFLATRLWWSGDLNTWITLFLRVFRGDDSGEMGVWSYAIVSLVADLIYGIVMAFIYVTSDIKESYRLWRESRFPDEARPVSAIEGEASAVQPKTIIDAIENLQNGMVAIQAQIDELREAKPANSRTTRSRGTK